MNRRWFLLRYDVESRDTALMQGFLAKMVEVHVDADLPVSLFCTGGALDTRETEFRSLRDAIAGDDRFDIGDHSYSHIGIGYEAGKPLETLKADYERSLAAHERILGKRPTSLTICGTGGADGARLSGFDATEKSRAELAMLATLGITSLNTFLTATDESREFTDYASLGYPHVSGFPSGFSDTSWLYRADKTGDFLAPLRDEIDQRAEANQPLPVICHDWVVWNHAPDRAFTHILKLADYAWSKGFTPCTHAQAVQKWKISGS